MTDGKYGLVYADPPWNYSNKGNGASDKHYPTMTNNEISTLPVWKWTTSSSVLILASTWPFIPIALQVMKAWGFKYVSGFPFIKTKRRPAVDVEGNLVAEPTWGLGMWSRGCSGTFLIGRGRNAKPPQKHWMGIISERLEHSKKPESIYEYCESLPGPYLELFARNSRPGWHSWGNEVQSDIDLFEGVRNSEGYINEKVLQIIAGMKDEWESAQNVRWQMGDMINQLQAIGMSPMDSYRAASDVMGKSVRWAVELSAVAKEFGPEYRDLSIEWHEYRNAYSDGTVRLFDEIAENNRRENTEHDCVG